MKKFLLLAYVLALCGCALTMSAERCRGMDWFWLGQKDGYDAAPPYTGSLLDMYTTECAVHGTKPDAEAYIKGLASGAQNRLSWWGPASRP